MNGRSMGLRNGSNGFYIVVFMDALYCIFKHVTTGGWGWSVHGKNGEKIQ